MTTSPAALRPTVNTGLPLGALFPGAADVTVTGVSLDSRSVRPGDLYVAVAGQATHGARFAVAVLGEVPASTSFLGVKKDPGTVWIFLGAVLAIVGASLAFYVRPHMVWVYQDADGRLLMGTYARGGEAAAKADLSWLVEQVSRLAV